MVADDYREPSIKKHWIFDKDIKEIENETKMIQKKIASIWQELVLKYDVYEIIELEN